jgi:hypothetical protein
MPVRLSMSRSRLPCPRLVKLSHQRVDFSNDAFGVPRKLAHQLQRVRQRFGVHAERVSHGKRL